MYVHSASESYSLFVVALEQDEISAASFFAHNKHSNIKSEEETKGTTQEKDKFHSARRVRD